MRNAESVIRELRLDPTEYWRKAGEAVDWLVTPEKTCEDDESGIARWFVGGEANLCYNAIDRHVKAGRDSQPALVFESAMTGDARIYSYAQLLEEVELLAGALESLGIGHGDRVVVYMPMVPEAVFAMLACVRLGAIHSVVFGGFADRELAKRIDDAKPRLVLSASCGLEPGRVVEYKPLLDAALSLSSHQPDHCLILQRPQASAKMYEPRDLDWSAVMATARPAGCVPVAATDPSYILYTSGTTGLPKGVVRDTGGHMVALLQSMRQVYDVSPGDVFWAASDIGWVVGHSYIVYGPLLLGATTVLFEGKPVGTPDAGAFWRLIDKHRVNVLFTAPTAFRAIRAQDPDGSYIAQSDLSSLRALFLAGERADPDTLEWAEAKLQIPVIDHWWQTELGWPALATCLGLGDEETLPGSAGTPVPGFDLVSVDECNRELPRGETGNLVIKLPLPPGTFIDLWQKPEAFRQSYFASNPGFYATGDAGYVDEKGFVHVMSRTDDLINVAGHRLSTGSMEEILAEHEQVVECAVIGVGDALKGQVPVGLVVVNAACQTPHETLGLELVKRVRDRLGPVASLRHVVVVAALPKTRSGKILRASLRKLADGESFTPPATIENPGALEVASQALASIGYPR